MTSQIIIGLGIISSVIEKCVLEYFSTFKFCWITLLFTFEVMIKCYVNLLNNVVNKLTEYPTCIYATINIFISLFFVVVIIHIIFKKIEFINI